MKLISRIRSKLGVELPIRSLFEAPTIENLSGHLSSEKTVQRPLQKIQRPERIPLSFAQRRLWFLNQLEEFSSTYSIPIVLHLQGSLNYNALQTALNDLIVRHESLRTIFPETFGVPEQRVLSMAEASKELKPIDIDKQLLGEAITELIKCGFDLAKEPPLRIHLLKIGTQEHVLVLLLHHIAGDGWSFGPLAHDLEKAYTARCLNTAPQFINLPVQYVDYTLWQQDILGNESDPNSAITHQISFWTNELADLPDQIDLPLDRTRPTIASYQGAQVALCINKKLHVDLVTLANQCQASLFMVLQASLAALLTRLGAGYDIPIGTPVAGRGDSALDGLVGFFVNTIVLRSKTDGNPNFRELIARTRSTNLAAYAHQDMPFERLVEIVNPTRSLNRHPLFQVMLTLQDADTVKLNLPDLTTTIEAVNTATSKFDLSLNFSENRSPEGVLQGINGIIEYSTDLFDLETIQSISDRFIRLLESAVANPDQSISKLSILSPDERHT
ncbi:condensation domain-containing protein, partial [Polynucleobacter sp. MG-28-Ekke-A2]|uniref:condensation domain-containing protein n=1 Tax=Polynucleobacter sp. MG-28-Ekke-A2 TaxID=3108276 RepID=UPI002B2281F6